MNILERDVCRIVCETGLAAVNHGFVDHAETIRSALPHLVGEPAVLRILQATLLIGLSQVREATELLAEDASVEANTLRRLIESASRDAPISATPPSSHTQLA